MTFKTQKVTLTVLTYCVMDYVVFYRIVDCIPEYGFMNVFSSTLSKIMFYLSYVTHLIFPEIVDNSNCLIYRFISDYFDVSLKMFLRQDKYEFLL